MPGASVAVDLDQPLVADPEVMCDLVPHDVAHLGGEHFRIRAVMPNERAAIDGHLVGKRCVVERRAVTGASPRQRYALVEPEVARTRRRLVFNRDLDVRDLLS